MPQASSFKTSKAGRFLLKHKKIFTVLALTILVLIVGELIVVNLLGSAPGSFLGLEPILLLVRIASFTAIFALCQSFCLSVGGFDLSIGWIATLTALVGANTMNGQDSGVIPALLVAIIIGAAIGSLNGVIVSMLKLPSLVVTMATGYIAQGFVEAYVGGSYIEGRPAPILRTITAGTTWGIPNMIFVLLIVCIIVSVLIHKTKMGVKLLGVGTNDTVAYLSGVNEKLVRFFAFVVSGAIAGVAGLLLAGNAGFVFKDMASTYVMPSFVAVVVGGVSIHGGEFNFLAVILGSFLLQALLNLFVALNWGDAGRFLGYGLILLVMLITYTRTKRSR